MMSEAGREVFDAFPGWVKVSFYVLAAASLGVFVLGTWLRVRRYRRASPAGRTDHLFRRIVRATRKVTMSRSRIWRSDPFAGLAHDFVLWGFGVLLLGTVILTVDEDVTKLFFGFSFLKGPVYTAYSLVLDVFGILFLAGLGMLLYRRARGRTRRLSYGEADGSEGVSLGRFLLDDRAFLGLLLLAGIGGFAAEGVRIYRDGTTWAQEWSPVGVAIAAGLGSLAVGPEAAASLHMILWWVHAAGALALIAYIPFSKAFHALAGFGSLVTADELAGRRLESRATSDPSGFRRLSDFTWVQLLQLDACVRCGRCHDVCPARASGRPLSPRGLIQGLRAHVARLERTAAGPVVGNAIEADALWACATCLACTDACPLQVEHLPLIVEMRRYLVAQGQMDSGLQAALAGLGRYGNSFRRPARERGRWAKDVRAGIQDAGDEPVDYLWFVGDYASFDPRCQEVSRRVAGVLSRLNLSVGFLGDRERNAGNDARRAGEEGLFEMLRDQNVEALKACKFRDVVTTDPHTYHALKNEYPSLNGGRVLHYTEVLDELVRSGRLAFSRKRGGRVTYHDPCYLGRYNGVYDAPRNVLRALGADVVEMPRNRSNSFCCGAGGGRIWMEESRGGERPAEIRVREAASLDGVGVLVVACPKDYVMFTDAAKTLGLEGSLQVRDLIELVEEAL